MKKSILLVMVLTFSMTMIFSAEKVGEISYFSGKFTITRNGNVLSEKKFNFGDDVQNFDLIKTGSKSTLKILTDPKTGIDTEISVGANTAFVLELSPQKTKQNGGLELMSGSVALTVRKISGSELNVKTSSSVMGVRGTVFEVALSMDDEVLITCNEGRVECKDLDSDKILYSEPGSVVEKNPGGAFKNLVIQITDLKEFQTRWITEKSSAFRANALRAIQNYAKRYDALYSKFMKAYEDLQTQKDLIKKWYDQDQKGSTGSSIEIMKDKKAIIKHLIALRRALFIFERVYIRLLELQEYHNEGIGVGLINANLTTTDFFKRFDRDKKTLETAMANFHYLMKLYAKRNDGTVPIDFSDSNLNMQQDKNSKTKLLDSMEF